MACWICTLGSAYSSILAPKSAIRYFQLLTNGFAISALSPHTVAQPAAPRAPGGAVRAWVPWWQPFATCVRGLGDISGLPPGSPDGMTLRVPAGPDETGGDRTVSGRVHHVTLDRTR